MADISDIEILEAYNRIRDDNEQDNWMLMKYVDGKSNKLVLGGCGSGGLEEFTSQLTPSEACYGYLRINVSNDELSQRSKFLLVSWCGLEVPVMRKAKLGVHLSSVKSICKSFSVEMPASELSDLNEADVLLLLKKAMGANYDRQATNY